MENTPRSQQRQKIIRELGKYSLSELKEICYRLGVNHEDLPGDGSRTALKMEFHTFMERQGRLPELVEFLKLYAREKINHSITQANLNAEKKSNALLSPTSQVNNNQINIVNNITNKHYGKPAQPNKGKNSSVSRSKKTGDQNLLETQQKVDNYFEFAPYLIIVSLGLIIGLPFFPYTNAFHQVETYLPKLELIHYAIIIFFLTLWLCMLMIKRITYFYLFHIVEFWDLKPLDKRIKVRQQLLDNSSSDKTKHLLLKWLLIPRVDESKKRLRGPLRDFWRK